MLGMTTPSSQISARPLSPAISQIDPPRATLQTLPYELKAKIIRLATTYPLYKLNEAIEERTETLRVFLLSRPFSNIAAQEFFRCLHVPQSPIRLEELVQNSELLRTVRSVWYDDMAYIYEYEPVWALLLQRCVMIESLWYIAEPGWAIANSEPEGMTQSPPNFQFPNLQTLVLHGPATAIQSPALRYLVIARLGEIPDFKDFLLRQITPSNLPNLKRLCFGLSSIPDEHKMIDCIRRFECQLELASLSLDDFCFLPQPILPLQVPLLWTFDADDPGGDLDFDDAARIEPRHLALLQKNFPLEGFLNASWPNPGGKPLKIKRIYYQREWLRQTGHLGIDTREMGTTLARYAREWELLLAWGRRYNVEIVELEEVLDDSSDKFSPYVLMDDVVEWEKKQVATEY